MQEFGRRNGNNRTDLGPIPEYLLRPLGFYLPDTTTELEPFMPQTGAAPTPTDTILGHLINADYRLKTPERKERCLQDWVQNIEPDLSRPVSCLQRFREMTADFVNRYAHSMRQDIINNLSRRTLPMRFYAEVIRRTDGHFDEIVFAYENLNSDSTREAIVQFNFRRNLFIESEPLSFFRNLQSKFQLFIARRIPTKNILGYARECAHWRAGEFNVPESFARAKLALLIHDKVQHPNLP